MSASVTDSPVTVATQVVGDLGLGGIFVLMLLGSACVLVSSEATTMLFGGFGVSQGRYGLVAITAAGVLGGLVRSWVASGVGRFGRRELCECCDRLRLDRRHLAWADRWLERYGQPTVFFSRILPIVRTPRSPSSC